MYRILNLLSEVPIPLDTGDFRLIDKALVFALKEMPEKPLRTEGIRSGLLESLNSSKPRFRNMSLSIRGWEKQGYVSDPRRTRKDVYSDVEFDVDYRMIQSI